MWFQISNVPLITSDSTLPFYNLAIHTLGPQPQTSLLPFPVPFQLIPPQYTSANMRTCDRGVAQHMSWSLCPFQYASGTSRTSRLPFWWAVETARNNSSYWTLEVNFMFQSDMMELNILWSPTISLRISTNFLRVHACVISNNRTLCCKISASESLTFYCFDAHPQW